MATAINFNWNHFKMANGKRYDISVESDLRRAGAWQVWKEGSIFYAFDGVDTFSMQIFRDGATVADLIACIMRAPASVRSGEVYKADILRLIDDTYTDDTIYNNGIQAPSVSVEHNTKRDGAQYAFGLELEVSCRNETCMRALSGMESNIFHMVSDSSISCYGIEFVSGALIAPKDATNPAFYEPLCNMLTGLAKSRTDRTTGLHFHIGREAFGDTKPEQMETIAKVIFMENYILNQRNLTAIYGRSISSDWARPNETKTDLTEAVAKVVKVAGARIMNDSSIRAAMVDDLTPYDSIRSGHNYPPERYQRINITNRATVEFRQGKGDINSKSLARIAQHIDVLVNYCKGSTWAKLSEDGYLHAIPNNNKFAILRDAWRESE